MISGHGNNISDYNAEIVADFSSNVYNNPVTSDIIDHLKGEFNCIRNYPDSNCIQLRTDIAKQMEVNSDNVLISNGSAEAFYLIAHAYKGAKSVIPIPSFSEYEDASKLYGHTIEFVPNAVGLNTLELSGKLLWLGNPNNPDGLYHSKSFLIKLISDNPETIFIIDEAYIDLYKGGESIASQVNYFPNLVVIKSFTKLFAIPGIRLGYIVANASTIKKIQTHHIPWAVNSLALKLGEYIMTNYENNETDISQIIEEARYLQQEVASIPGMTVVESQTNFFLVKLADKKASELKDYLIANYGFLIRDAANFRGLSSEWFRIASQGIDIDCKLIIALKNWAKLSN